MAHEPTVEDSVGMLRLFHSNDPPEDLPPDAYVFNFTELTKTDPPTKKESYLVTLPALNNPEIEDFTSAFPQFAESSPTRNQSWKALGERIWAAPRISMVVQWASGELNIDSRNRYSHYHKGFGLNSPQEAAAIAQVKHDYPKTSQFIYDAIQNYIDDPLWDLAEFEYHIGYEIYRAFVRSGIPGFSKERLEAIGEKWR